MKHLNIVLIISVVMAGCIEEYPPPVTNEAVDFLVVDGTLNTTDGNSEIRLTRAYPLSSNEPPPLELNAQLTIEDSDGAVFPLTEDNGTYSVSNIPVDTDKQYRLKIRRADGRTYQSAFVSAKKTPDLDSVTWRESLDGDAFEIVLNTHDDNKDSRYYLWTYEETYEYTAVYNSTFRLEVDTVLPIPFEESVYRCWITEPSKDIFIGTTENLNSDIVRNFPILRIPIGSEKLIIKYSINIKQRALTREAYRYWSELKKTTENLGGLFDPQPGRVSGNITNINDSNEPVIGYFDIGEVKEERLFIKASDLPTDKRSYLPLKGCQLDSVLVEDAIAVGINGYSYVSSINEGLVIVGYTYSTERCTDCRIGGGTTNKPIFWQ